MERYTLQGYPYNCRTHLEKLKIWDGTRKLQIMYNKVAIPVTEGAATMLDDLVDHSTGETCESDERRIVMEGIEMQLTSVSLPESKRVK